MLAMFDELLPELSFGDNVRPSHVTEPIRDRLVSRQKRTRQSAIVAVIAIVLLFNIGFSLIALEAPSVLTLRSMFVWDLAVTVGMLFAIWSWHSRRIAFLREASVAPAAVMEADLTTLWGFGGLPSWMRGTARNLSDELEDEDEGASEEVIRIVRVRLRFRPGHSSERLTWEDLRDEVPHLDVTKWLLSGGWGTFAYGLKRGSLVSLFYEPQNPRDCRIVPRFHSR
jgi:hypothetical protein